MADLALTYFVTINELTAHNTGATQEEVAQAAPSPLAALLEPYIPYTPFVLFGLLFTVAFGLLVVNRVKNLKNITAAMILALVTASIPTVISYVSMGSRQAVNAGPDEIPREVRVVPDSPSTITISWHTDAPHTGVVRFGVASLTPQTARMYVANDRTKVTDHTIRVTGLKKGKSYEFEILSGTTWYDNAGTPIKFTEK